MPTADRYFVESPIGGDVAVLAGPEAHHLIHVMRAKAGLRVVLFDGSGAEFTAVVEEVKHAEVRLSIVARQDANRELPVHVTLGVALPKGERQKWLVEKAVELGVGRLVPLRTARSVAQPVEQALARLARTVIEASKQSCRNRLMEITEPQTWMEHVEATRGVAFRLMAHPDARRGEGRSFPLAGLTAGEGAASQVFLAIGPEGGFTAEEVSLAVAAGWKAVDLGPRILRVETAAILMAAIVAESLMWR